MYVWRRSLWYGRDINLANVALKSGIRGMLEAGGEEQRLWAIIPNALTGEYFQAGVTK